MFVERMPISIIAFYMVVCRDDNETGFLGYLIILPF